MQRTMVRTQLHGSRQQALADLDFWLAQPVQSRIDAVEALRDQNAQGKPDAHSRLQRVCRVTELKRG